MTPQTIKDELSLQLFGQEKAKDVLSFAFYLHLLRNNKVNEAKSAQLPKSNVLVLGSTGSGKRLMINTFTKTHDLPCLKIDSNLFLNTQNFNEVLDAHLRFLIQQFGIEKAKMAVIVFEDFDKIVAQRGGNNNADVQDEFLAMIEQEDKLLQLEAEKPPISFPIQNIMFIFSGKFSGIDSLVYMRIRVTNKKDEIIKRKADRLDLIAKFRSIKATEVQDDRKKLESIGFKNATTIALEKSDTAEVQIKSDVEKLYNELKDDELENLVENAFQKELLQEMQEDLSEDGAIVTKIAHADLINYGMQPELISRIGFIAPFERLTEEDILHILQRTSGNIINQYKQYFEVLGNTLEIKQKVYSLIAKEVEKRNVGTRSINAIVLQLLKDFLYIAPNNTGQTFVLDEAYFKKIFK